MDQDTGTLNWNGANIKYFMAKNGNGLRDVVLLLDPAGHVREIEHLEVVRKVQGLNANMLVIFPEIKPGTGDFAGGLSDALAFACGSFGFGSPVLIGSGYAALAIVKSIINGMTGSSGSIAISPEYRESVFSMLYRIEAPVWYVYGREASLTEERTMFRYHDLTAGSRLIKVSGNARDFFVERPSQFISLLADYLDHA
jgi:hypothetical protein